MLLIWILRIYVMLKAGDYKIVKLYLNYRGFS